MKNLLVVCTGLLIAVSCKNEPAKQETAKSDEGISKDSSTVNSAAATNKYCYANFKSKDTVILSFTQSDTTITGNLLYKFFEKDKNLGTINGVIKGDTIIADYSFSAEGTTSNREVVFLKKNGELVEGFGDVEAKDGKMIFRNRSALTFDNSVVLQSTDCSKIPAF